MTADDELIKIANDSGFPLQIALQNSVNASSSSHGWQVRHVEHAWYNGTDNQSGFIDLVLRDRHDFANLVLECKRVRNATWLFMNSSGDPKPRRHSKSWVTKYNGSQTTLCGWHEVPIDPATPEAQFCAVRGQSTNDKNTLLERIAGELISATEALAIEERDYRHESEDSLRFYFNVIVTTAALKVATFAPSDISLSEGMIANAEFADVPFVRVRKQFSMRSATLSPQDWSRRDDPDYRRENTVFVVRADALLDFLRQFDIPNSSFRQVGLTLPCT